MRFTVDIFMPPVCKGRDSMDRDNSQDLSPNLEQQGGAEEGGEEPMDLEEDNQSETSTLSSNQSEASEATVVDSATEDKESTDKTESTEDGQGDIKVEPISVNLKERPADLKLFHLRYCTGRDGLTDYEAAGLDGRVIRNKGEEPLQLLDIAEDTVLAMDWINKKYSEDFVMVETKKDVDHEDLEIPSIEEKKQKELELTDLLQLFAEKEILSDQECWYCNGCKEHVEASKALLLWRLPSLLIVQLKRFIYSSHIFRSKNDRAVNYPLQNLDVKPYLCPGAPEQETLFDLYGVVCHSGSSYFGHYVSHGRLSDYDSMKTEIGWRLFNDSFVSDNQPFQAIDDDAYLLFYKRRGTDTKTLIENYETFTSDILVKKEAYEVFMDEHQQKIQNEWRESQRQFSPLPSTSSWSTSTWDPSGLDEDTSAGFSELPQCGLGEEE